MIVSPPVLIEKSLGHGRFSGLAWSFMDTPDREGDVILPSALEAAAKSGTRPCILIEHRKGEVAGEINYMGVTDRGLEVEGQIDLGIEVGRKAYGQVQARELGSLSMGFEGRAERSGNTRVFTQISLGEISLCRNPVNAGSRIAAVKSWGEVDSELSLERLLHDVAGMPNRLARKSASLVWPALNTEQSNNDQAEAIARRIQSITAQLRNQS